MDAADEGVKAEMNVNEEECYVCHQVMNKYWMEEIHTGRTVRWICAECYKHGGRQADWITKRIIYAKKKKENR